MSEKIEPALSAEEWEARATEYGMLSFAPGSVSIMTDCGGYNTTASTYDLAKVIAMANAALPDSDPQKITQEDVTLLERCEASVGWKHEEAVRALSAKIAALLPPP